MFQGWRGREAVSNRCFVCVIKYDVDMVMSCFCSKDDFVIRNQALGFTRGSKSSGHRWLLNLYGERSLDQINLNDIGLDDTSMTSVFQYQGKLTMIIRYTHILLSFMHHHRVLVHLCFLQANHRLISVAFIDFTVLCTTSILPFMHGRQTRPHMPTCFYTHASKSTPPISSMKPHSSTP